MNWAISLKVTEDESTERRLELIMRNVLDKHQIKEILLYDIDATGNLGNQLTKKINVNKGTLVITQMDIMNLIVENGQIFELDLLFTNSCEFRFIVRDGYYIDILGNGDRIPSNILGDFQELDINSYNLGG